MNTLYPYEADQINECPECGFLQKEAGECKDCGLHVHLSSKHTLTDDEFVIIAEQRIIDHYNMTNIKGADSCIKHKQQCDPFIGCIKCAREQEDAHQLLVDAHDDPTWDGTLPF